MNERISPRFCVSPWSQWLSHSLFPILHWVVNLDGRRQGVCVYVGRMGRGCFPATGICCTNYKQPFPNEALLLMGTRLRSLFFFHVYSCVVLRSWLPPSSPCRSRLSNFLCGRRAPLSHMRLHPPFRLAAPPTGGQLIIKYYLHIYSGAKLSWLLVQ